MLSHVALRRAPSGTWTLDKRIKSPLLYQLSYVPIPNCPQLIVVGRAGLEPTTNGLKVRCSTNWANDPFAVVVTNDVNN